MYFVKLDNQTFYDPRIEEYKIFNPKLKLEVNKAGAFDFTVYPSHPLFARIFKLKSIVEVYQDSTLLFRGRVLDDELAFDKAKKVYCEGELAYFNDTVLRPYEHTGSVQGYLELIVNQHNSQVPTAKQFTVGNVTVTDPNDLIVRSDATYPQTWNVVESKLINSLGGYLVIRRVGNVNYLDYLKDSNYMSLQEIKLGKNLLDLATKSSATELYTAILPIGKELEDANGQGTGEYLTIKSVNGGVDYVKDDEAIEKYGFIVKKVEWRDVTIASNLLTKARQELAQSIKLSLSLNLTAIDLSMTDSTIDEFRVFEYVNVVSNPHGIEERLLIEKQELNLTNPSQDKLTIGVQRKSLTETQIQTEKALGNITTIKGPKGDKGESVDDITVEFYLSTSKTELVGGEWKTEPDKWIAGHYMWTRNKIVYKNPARTEYTTPVLDSSWEAIEDLEQDIKNELDDKASSDYVTSVETTLNTTIEESAGEFRREISETYTSKNEFGSYQETIATQFDQTAKGFDLTFKNLIEQIETLDDDTRATFDEIVKYIRFVDGNIILGKVGNELELKIRHDRIQFIQSGVEVAYFSNNKLYVTDGEFINSLKLGNFAFIPRENGSLDFRKVVN